MLKLVWGILISFMGDKTPFDFRYQVNEILFQEVSFCQKANQSHSVISLDKEVLGVDVFYQIAINGESSFFFSEAQQIRCNWAHPLDIANLIIPWGKGVEDVGDVVPNVGFLLRLLDEVKELRDRIAEHSVISPPFDHIFINYLKLFWKVLGVRVE